MYCPVIFGAVCCAEAHTTLATARAIRRRELRMAISLPVNFTMNAERFVTEVRGLHFIASLGWDGFFDKRSVSRDNFLIAGFAFDLWSQSAGGNGKAAITQLFQNFDLLGKTECGELCAQFRFTHNKLVRVRRS